jgi:hypothetical protein
MARRLYNPLQVAAIDASNGGIDTDSDPGTMNPSMAPVVNNLLPDRPGKLIMRGPLQNHAELALTGTNKIIGGAWTFRNKALIGMVAPSATGQREPWSAPYKKAPTAATLAIPETTMQFVDFDSLSTNNVAGSLDTVISGKGAALGNYVYGYGYAANSAAVNENGGFFYRRKLLRWDGTAAAPTAYNNAPDNGSDVHSHLNRLWTLGGRDVAGGGTATEFSTLFYSDGFGPVSDTAAAWQDDVSGLSNKIVVDYDNPDDFGVSLAKVGQNLIIFKRYSSHVLYGFNSSTFTIRPMSLDIGCLDPRSVVEFDNGCFFLSDQGFMYYDGSQITNFSRNQKSALLDAANGTVGLNGVDGGRAIARRINNEYVLLSIYSQDFATGLINPTPKFCGLLYVPTQSWTTFSSNVTATPTPTWIDNTSRTPFIIDGRRVVKATNIVTPERAPESERGFDSVTTTAVQTKARIPSRWTSQLLRLATPPVNSQIHRMLLDYVFQIDEAGDNTSNGWYVSLTSGTGKPLLTEYQVPNQGDPTQFLYRRRETKDVFTETSDVQFNVEWKADVAGTYPAVKSAEIHEGVIEFQLSSQRRST